MLTSPLLQPAQGYIGNRWHDAHSGTQLEVLNPATGQVIARVPDMGAAETRAAVAAARAALAVRPSLEQRRDWLQGIHDALLREKRELARILTHEHGKPLAEAQGEVEYAAGFFAYCAREIQRLAPRVLAEEPKGCRWTVHHRPIGVVGLITPWNFPIGMIAKKLSAALAAGSPSVIKPAQQTPLTMIAFMHLLDTSLELPPGMVNLVMGDAATIGDVLCTHPDVAMISFTGSTGVGRLLIRNTADQVKKLSLELGGNAPFIVFDDADLEQAADQLVANKLRGSGQTCVCANRVFVARSLEPQLARMLAERVERLRVGDGMDPETDLGPLIDEAGFGKVRRHLEDALEQGAQWIAGAMPDSLDPARDLCFPPTVLCGATDAMLCAREETFGPLFALFPFDSEDEVVARANDTEFGLAAYLFTRDGERARRVIEALHFGHCAWNTGTGPTPEAPFGGMKQSGFGQEGGEEGLFEFVVHQTSPEAL
ncbi:MAG: NAD-dependent succinate-semialdehyde dehydrogenase [Pseudomonadales bacterium]|jgi:succinate-semialdehyde dehydrogenase/glutarate-semialdehyde dehydrogenase|nr:NAD-dependent succinate-semialdehyde dehydrogenase [Pseudomonadales bacterium]